MEDQIVGNQSLHRVDRLLTWRTHFLLRLKAEGLSTYMYRFTTFTKDTKSPLRSKADGSAMGQECKQKNDVNEGWAGKDRRCIFTLDRWTGFSSVVLLVSCTQKEKQTLHLNKCIQMCVKTKKLWLKAAEELHMEEKNKMYFSRSSHYLYHCVSIVNLISPFLSLFLFAPSVSLHPRERIRCLLSGHVSRAEHSSDPVFRLRNVTGQ